ncbi:TonB-dependent receptor domain-containing protein [Coprobacter sp.]
MKLYYWIILSFFCNIFFVQANKPDSIITHKPLKTITISKTRNKNNTITVSPDSLIQYGNSLNDILSFFPSLEGDMDGNIRLRGSDKIAFFINGRPTSLLGDYRNEMLIQLPASAIKQILVDYAPDITQRTEGSAGIINIILKETQSNAPAGEFYLDAANNDRYGAGAHIGTPLSSQWKLHAGIDYKREYRKRIFQNNIISRENDIVTNEQIQNNSAIAHPQTIAGSLGSEFNLEKHSFRTDFSFIQMQFDRTGNIHNSETQKEMKVIRDNEQCNRQYNATATYNYKHNNRISIFADLSYRHTTYDENNDYQRNVLRPKTNLIQDKLFINQKNNEYELNLTGTFRSFKAGYSAWFTSSGNTNKKEIFTEGIYTETPAATFDMALNRDVHSLFLQYRRQWYKWHLSVGLRGEYTHQSIYLTNNNNPIKQNYWNLFPAITFSYNNGQPGHSWQILYRQRTNRPVFSELNPFLNQSDPQEIIQGNPHLKPETSYNTALSYSYTNPIITFTPTLFYRNRKQTITQITREDQVITPENLFRTQSAGGELKIYIFPAKWIYLHFNGCIYYDEIQADKNRNKRGDWAWNSNGIISFRLSSTTTLQCHGTYISDLQTVQGKVESRYRIDTGIKQNILSGQGQVTLQINDWLGSAKEITIIDTSTLYKRTEKRRDNRTVWLGFTWKFNMNKQNINKLNLTL